jgi:hypothetical protein
MSIKKNGLSGFVTLYCDKAVSIGIPPYISHPGLFTKRFHLKGNTLFLS